ncbi:uncharacterized protein AMSG_06052 [Thecamonas trahens ATCC 50062]|uniref:RING-type domain-containing protein n=1 Tax=Thecamonas trahens ATCC 50062 TaxID=461836 RepID=A0A0L0DEL7_THETB|nr:hypothetical protein AMSG_06052 [Thecamonas trahens ATCC 50062]KNC49773.1 hypothetical protein AMSG_06052 [Thecamonas trahens ATCC 50062]|eukprot:XP_013757557.1 hypothetical protein AMSG_06052 [Thecamonas trahens ATCC 50062]
MESDLPLTIPLATLASHFDCPICLTTLSDTAMLPCGHNFCRPCILECLNREHLCPCCRAAATAADARPNHHLDATVALIETEADKASRAYFEQLTSGRDGGGGGGGSDAGAEKDGQARNVPVRDFTPIERVFQTAMRASLAAYTEYYDKVKVAHETSLVNLQRSAAAELTQAKSGIAARARAASLAGNTESETELNAQLEQVMVAHTQAFEAKLSAERAKFDASVSALVDAYSRYLDENVPAVEFVPVPLSLSVPSRSLVLDGSIVLDPMHTVEDVHARAIELLCTEEHGITQWEIGSVEYVLDEQVLEPGTGVPIRAACGAELVAGASIELRGELASAADVCFSALPFEDGAGVRVTYYSCDECSKAWICESCAKACHAGHTVSLHLCNYEPNYACCYCVRTKCCVLENAKTLKKKRKLEKKQQAAGPSA